MTMLQHSVIESGGYNIQRSLRFRSSASAYLSRTWGVAPTSTSIATFSVWVKRGKIGAFQTIMRTDTATTSTIQFETTDQLTFQTSASNATSNTVKTTQVFRDPSAWYHIVWSINNSTGAWGIYVNGVQVTSFSTNAPSSGGAAIQFVGNGNTTKIGGTGGDYIDGYLAEVNFIDGQALTPSSFGQTDPVTGVWTPKKYTGTYGTNGFYLPFSDNTSATTLAYDKSGNGNNWTPNNISTTAGATYDSMTDVPTLTSATAANYCVLNPLNTNGNVTVSAGNLDVVGTSTTDTSVGSTFAVSSGKWYCEATFTVGASHDFIGVGITTPQNSLSQAPGYYSDGYMVGFGTNNSTFYKVNNNSYVDASSNYSGAGTYVVQIALDMDNGKVWFGRNNTWISSGDPAAGTNATYSGISSSNPQMVKWWGDSSGPASMNFGQRPFSYTPPDGFKALNTFNLPDPTIKKPNQYMDVGLYTGTGSASALAVSGPPNPDLVWIKGRSVAYSHSLLDNQRTTGTPFSRRLYSNLTSAEYDYGSSLLTPTTTGFNLTTSDGDHNTSGATYVGWQWKKGATPGFDIVTYTGDGIDGRTVSHSLGVAPKMVIVKSRSTVTNWIVKHSSLSSNNTLELNSTAAQGSPGSGYIGDLNSSTTITLKNGGSAITNVNGSGTTYVAYLFAEIAGFSKFGSYTGNGSTDGPFVYCGFRPRWVMIKRTDAVSNWSVWDTSRSPYNSSDVVLSPNISDAEQNTSAYPFDIVSNGIKIRNTGNSYGNTSGGTYIYAAFAENPFKYSLAR